MNIYFDCEFNEDGKTIDLISIGLVRADGTSYYGINANFDWYKATGNEWLAEHVLPHLPLVKTEVTPFHTETLLDYKHKDVRFKSQLAFEVGEFIRRTPDPVLWAYYGAYDHVALAQLWGPMINLPAGVPMYTNDIMQKMESMGIEKSSLPKQTANEHNALHDALHNKAMYEYLDRIVVP